MANPDIIDLKSDDDEAPDSSIYIPQTDKYDMIQLTASIKNLLQNNNQMEKYLIQNKAEYLSNVTATVTFVHACVAAIVCNLLKATPFYVHSQSTIIKFLFFDNTQFNKQNAKIINKFGKKLCNGSSSKHELHFCPFLFTNHIQLFIIILNHSLKCIHYITLNSWSNTFSYSKQIKFGHNHIFNKSKYSDYEVKMHKINPPQKQAGNKNNLCAFDTIVHSYAFVKAWIAMISTNCNFLCESTYKKDIQSLRKKIYSDEYFKGFQLKYLKHNISLVLPIINKFINDNENKQDIEDIDVATESKSNEFRSNHNHNANPSTPNTEIKKQNRGQKRKRSFDCDDNLAKRRKVESDDNEFSDIIKKETERDVGIALVQKYKKEIERDMSDVDNTICVKCKKDPKDQEWELLLCDFCITGAAHCSCQDPPYTAIPDGSWACYQCIDEIKKEYNDEYHKLHNKWKDDKLSLKQRNQRLQEK